MHARTIREGSVGLLILVGIGLFGFLVLWLRGFDFGDRNYRFLVEFDDTAGMQVGAPVRYRGVPVGEVTAIQPSANGVGVEVEIIQSGLLIPRDVIIEANQSGFVSETSIDITPLQQLSATHLDNRPLGRNCNSAVVICDGDRVEGQVGVSLTKLIRSTVQLSDQFTDPELFANIQNLTKNSADAATEVAELSEEVTTLVRVVRDELGPLSESARTVATSVSQAADQISSTAAQTNELLSANRTTLVSTLENLSATSLRLRSTVDAIAPVAERGELVRNLEVLTANAAAASANLRDISNELNDPTTVLMLQQTLDSARATFQNVQKITSDVDDLTGDPQFRENLRELINGLSGLVSSTQQLEQQTQIARSLAPSAPSPSSPPPTASSPTASSPTASSPTAATPTPPADLQKHFTPDAIAQQYATRSLDPSANPPDFVVTSRVGERIQIAFPVVRPVPSQSSESPQ